MNDLSVLKPLSASQYDTVKANALKRVQKRIGDKPTRRQFKREYAPLFGVLDVFALVVFLSALAISSVHILAHVQAQSVLNQHEPIQIIGIIISAHDATVIQQIGMVILAEFAMLLFMTVWSIERKKPQATIADKIQTHSMLLLAFTSMTFVMIANVNTGIGLLESVIPPMFTIGIGLRLEHIIVEMINRRDEIDAKYLQAMTTYETAIDDPTQHPDYQSILKRGIWDKLISLRDNASYADAPTSFKVSATYRELERDNWTKQADYVTAKHAIQEPQIDDDDTQPSDVILVSTMPATIERDEYSKSVASVDPVTANIADNIKHCLDCNKPIINARHNQKYCNTACRQSSYRKRATTAKA